MPEIVFVTILQETVNDESVRILSWKVPSGSKVEKDQQLCEVETSKAVMDIEAPEAGTVLYSAAAGDEVPVGSTICQIVPEGMAVPSMVETATEIAQGDPVGQAPAVEAPVLVIESSPVSGPPAASSTAKEKIPADQAIEPVIDAADLPPARLTPLAAKLAAELGFAKESFARGSLVRRDDVLRRAGKLPANVPATSPAKAAAPVKAAPAEPVENAPVSGVGVEWADLPRRKIFEAKVLGQGQARTVQSQVTSSVRAPRLRARLERLGLTSVGLGALTIFEAARLLRKYPEFNAIHDRGKIGTYSDVNVGWAIDSGTTGGGQGLMVPVVPQADKKTPQEIVEIMQRHIDGYVEGKLATSDFLGGTFTISDLSGDGISHFHPLISQGQSAILGVGGELDEAGNETLYLTLAFDHQLAEGRKAAQFVRELAARLEAHAALEPAPVQAAPVTGEPYCALCQRDRDALKSIRGILVRSEIPAGYVCSVCLAELS
jgi:pyruvate/2-oxoglutarate dehydrogenase complex dihydrolipoamide acyltransferase (E2) component